ncbi:GNAT family N-acetyltransferase [Yimella sp. cx-51]|uniref:GNAT family N-acetyltransferase n=1 Tax=Yimella sp. cx-51 TaxID=2770551 RepID=UPI00165D412F|nr:GNAT family N-acetyltransferase [Yimella sp. cx-51]MBC9957046.1 GNAT family N-acetyltransferase [Yimella sp. cx-51]QTH37288.1 GNAT family N-acetyltransferase [Yimella sp. cx-51]
MSLPDYEIRRPTLDDADDLGHAHVQIWREAYDGLMDPAALAALDPRKRADRWRTIIAGTPPERRTFIARHLPTGAVAGFVTVDVARDDDAPTVMELWAINLLAAHHGTGLAQALLDEALGAQDAYLWVVDGNDRAQAFYRRNGFVDDGGRKRDDDLGVNEVRMTRSTRKPLQR